MEGLMWKKGMRPIPMEASITNLTIVKRSFDYCQTTKSRPYRKNTKALSNKNQSIQKSKQPKGNLFAALGGHKNVLQPKRLCINTLAVG